MEHIQYLLVTNTQPNFIKDAGQLQAVAYFKAVGNALTTIFIGHRVLPFLSSQHGSG